MAYSPADGVRRKPRRPRLKFRDERFFYWVALGPSATLIAFVIVLPIVYTLALGFFDQNTLTRIWRFVGFANYGDLLTDLEFWIAFRNGVVFTAGSTLLATAFGLGVAVLLDCNFRGRGAHAGARDLSLHRAFHRRGLHLEVHFQRPRHHERTF